MPAGLPLATARIAEIGEDRVPERGIDLGGDSSIPGSIELHTDHLESALTPRAHGATGTRSAAVLAYDAQIAASGITTVFEFAAARQRRAQIGAADVSHTLAEAIGEAPAGGVCCGAEHRRT